MEDMKRCPFCNGGSLRVASILDGWHVICVKCRARGPDCGNKDLAITAWNHRTLETIHVGPPAGESSPSPSDPFLVRFCKGAKVRMKMRFP